MQLRNLLLSFAAFIASATAVSEETKSLDQLYQDAIKEGGKLVIYHGGDTPTQQDWLANAFRAAYPKVNLTMVVDYSKYHDVRVDNQLATNSLVPDIIALQTLQNFPRWKKEGKLLNYKPNGFSKIYQPYVDPDGAWFAHATFSFSYFYDTALLAAAGLPAPQSAQDLANPIYKDHIASTYPHDDDAALFVYSQYIAKYGWSWVAKMATQNLYFHRGSNTPGAAVSSKLKPIGVAGSAPAGTVVIHGKNATTPYLAWGQRMAILKKAKRPAAAKLFVNWVISKEFQSTGLAARTSRTDIPSPTGEPQPWEISQANVPAFPTFMEDRANIERLKATLALYFGEVQGEPSPGFLGLYPGL